MHNKQNYIISLRELKKYKSDFCFLLLKSTIKRLLEIQLILKKFTSKEFKY